MTDREIFRNNLINLINVSKVKQIDIARYANVSYQTVSSWVCGRGYPRADAMERLCKFFGIKQSVLTENGDSDNIEDKLITIFRKLNDTGKEKLLDRADELLKLYPKVKRNGKAKETR